MLRKSPAAGAGILMAPFEFLASLHKRRPSPSLYKLLFLRHFPFLRPESSDTAASRQSSSRPSHASRPSRKPLPHAASIHPETPLTALPRLPTTPAINQPFRRHPLHFLLDLFLGLWCSGGCALVFFLDLGSRVQLVADLVRVLGPALDLVLGFGQCSKLVYHRQGQVAVEGSAARASGISAPSMLNLESPSPSQFRIL
jgi:hypothetical protein